MRKVGCILFIGAASAALGQGYEQATLSARNDLDAALNKLDRIQQDIAELKIPLSKERDHLMSKAIGLRRQMEQISQLSDSKRMNLQAMEQEIKKREEEIYYITSLMDDYIQRFETQIHISEGQLYQELINFAKRVQGNESIMEEERLIRQVSVVQKALERIHKLAGGDIFKGKALSPTKVQKSGTFSLVGPFAFFSSDQSETAGLVILQTGSIEPTVVGLGEKATRAIQQFSSNREGLLPVDPTLGDAMKIAQTEETFLEHVKKGQVVGYFILGLAAFVLVIAVVKWIEISGVKPAKPDDLHEILDLLHHDKNDEALAKARSIKGPVGLLLTDAVEHAEESKDLLEEVLYERLLQTQPKLERFVPFIAVVAATAPLLGLLGTVTGMIKTFKLITLFGTGDARSLSSGISEALITTEFGLCVAIPALIIHAMLLRKTKSVLASMEQTAVAFKNGLLTKL